MEMEKGGRHCFRSVYLDACTVFVMSPPNEHTSEGGRDDRARGPVPCESIDPSSAQASAHSSPSGAGRWSSQTLLLRRKYVLWRCALVYERCYEPSLEAVGMGGDYPPARGPRRPFT